MKRKIYSVALLAGSLLLTSCLSKQEKLAMQLARDAEAAFGRQQFSQVVSNITTALTLDPEGSPEGTWTFLRGQAYEATGQYEYAVRDFETSVSLGTKWLSSYTLNSNPEPGAKADWFRTLSRYHNALGRALAKSGKYEQALGAFGNAISVAGNSVNKVGLTDQVVGNVFGGEKGKHRDFGRVVGAFYYNAGLMEEKLGRSGRSGTAKDIARQLNYDKALVLPDDIALPLQQK